MRAHLRHHAIAYLALFVALGGTSYAAVELRKGQVKSRHIATGAVTSADVKNRSLRAKDLRRGVLRRGATGPQGPAGAAGPAGRDGVAGPPGPTASAYAERDGDTLSLPNGDQTSVVSTTVTSQVPSRIVASGGVHVANTGTTQTFYCFTYVAGDAAPPARETVATNQEATLPVGGALVVPAGTHTVDVRCGDANNDGRAENAWLSVVASATG